MPSNIDFYQKLGWLNFIDVDEKSIKKWFHNNLPKYGNFTKMKVIGAKLFFDV